MPTLGFPEHVGGIFDTCSPLKDLRDCLDERHTWVQLEFGGSRVRGKWHVKPLLEAIEGALGSTAL
ncbi:hypothetical protein MVI01_09640 [Myxococcus virescens]|uniref:Uncharacterized protein n=1 Tax=Myxococcus virescens TaxID=83456 RepID=A0A511H6N8_9BACT|nr:hypothetical protein MVI01_09640 [Myxococcus virescens]